MSASALMKHLFLVYAPDKTDEGALQRRLSVRPEHLKGAFALHEQGILSCVVICTSIRPSLLTDYEELGGAMLTPESVSSPDATKTLIGSTLIYSASTLDEVRRLVEADVYYTNGVVCPLIVCLDLLTNQAINDSGTLRSWS